jgi:hypothetical protein
MRGIAGPWIKATATLDAFIADDYNFLLENSDVQRLTGFSAKEVEELAEVVCRKSNSRSELLCSASTLCMNMHCA